MNKRKATTLSNFLRSEVDAIVDEFADFAQTHVRSAKLLNPAELRDSAASLICRIADDMDSTQSAGDQSDKSRGDAPGNAPALTDDAKTHARDRLLSSFTLDEIVAEYRALRASVIRRWRGAEIQDTTTVVDEVIRFNEAIDQALTESIAWYSSQANQARDLVVGMIAHDLRNPLGAIIMSSHYLLRSPGLGGAETKTASRILASASVMEKMVADLLDFAQVRMGGHLSIHKEPADFCTICSDAVNELRAFHPERTIHLEVEGRPKGIWDFRRMRQVVSNLVGNALVHGTTQSPVTVSAALTKQGVRLDVHNVGEPIAERDQAQIFDPLKRLPSAEARSSRSVGAGLGLFIVKEIAEAHGGSVGLSSTEEAGTTFTVIIPVEAKNRPEA